MICVSEEWLNYVIRGKVEWRKCPNCDADAIEFQSYDENGEPCENDAPTAFRESCDDCEGVGFIEIPK